MTEQVKLLKLEEEVNRLTSLIAEYKLQTTSGQYVYLPNIPLPKHKEFKGGIKASVKFFKTLWNNYMIAS